VGDDGRYTWKECAHCEVLVSGIYRLDPDLAYNDEGLDAGEWMHEYGSYYPAVARLFRAKWHEPDSLVLVPLAAAIPAAVPTEETP